MRNVTLRLGQGPSVSGAKTLTAGSRTQTNTPTEEQVRNTDSTTQLSAVIRLILPLLAERHAGVLCWLSGRAEMCVEPSATSPEREDNMKTLVALIGLAGVLAFSSAAFAQSPYLDRYNEISQHPNPNAQCGTGAGSGAFGYFGKDYNLGGKTPPSVPGTDGYQTGLNNSAVCGNRQDNLPD
jgi:hypothetical protein